MIMNIHIGTLLTWEMYLYKSQPLLRSIPRPKDGSCAHHLKDKCSVRAKSQNYPFDLNKSFTSNVPYIFFKKKHIYLLYCSCRLPGNDINCKPILLCPNKSNKCICPPKRV